MKLINKIFRNIVRLFIRKPKESLNWTASDFKKAKRYCKYENHPVSKDLTLWDYIHNEQDDSVWTIHKLNVHLGLR